MLLHDSLFIFTAIPTQISVVFKKKEVSLEGKDRSLEEREQSLSKTLNISIQMNDELYRKVFEQLLRVDSIRIFISPGRFINTAYQLSFLLDSIDSIIILIQMITLQ